jgi:hypothetical protein
MRTFPYINNSLFISWLLVGKKYFHGNMGIYKIGKAPSAYRPRVLLLGEIPQNAQRNEKRTIYVEAMPLKYLKNSIVVEYDGS